MTNRRYSKATIIIPLALVAIALIGFGSYKGSLLYEASKHVCSSDTRTVVLNQNLTPGQLSVPVAIKPGMSYWINGSSIEQQTNEIFGSLFYVNLHYIQAGTPPHTTYSAETSSYSGSDTSVKLYKKENWYRLDTKLDRVQFYTDGKQAEASSIHVVSCQQPKWL